MLLGDELAYKVFRRAAGPSSGFAAQGQTRVYEDANLTIMGSFVPSYGIQQLANGQWIKGIQGYIVVADPDVDLLDDDELLEIDTNTHRRVMYIERHRKLMPQAVVYLGLTQYTR